jgi:hypothetical protein
LTENINLYYTNTRFDTSFDNKIKSNHGIRKCYADAFGFIIINANSFNGNFGFNTTKTILISGNVGHFYGIIQTSANNEISIFTINTNHITHSGQGWNDDGSYQLYFRIATVLSFHMISFFFLSFLSNKSI